MASRTILISALVMMLLGAACTGPSGDGSDDGVICGGKNNVKCSYLTMAVNRGVLWREYCLEQPDCAEASENGLFTWLGPTSAANYPDYDRAHLVCTEVTITAKDGAQGIHRFVVLEAEDRQTFEIIEEVTVESCVNVSQ